MTNSWFWSTAPRWCRLVENQSSESPSSNSLATASIGRNWVGLSEKKMKMGLAKSRFLCQFPTHNASAQQPSQLCLWSHGVLQSAQETLNILRVLAVCFELFPQAAHKFRMIAVNRVANASVVQIHATASDYCVKVRTRRPLRWFQHLRTHSNAPLGCVATWW